MKRYFDIYKLVTTGLLLIMVGSLARSIEQARWTAGLHVLLPIAVVGVVVGVLLAGSTLGTLRAHVLGFLTGVSVITWQTGSLLSVRELEDGNRFSIVWSRFRQWLRVVIEGGASYDQLLFVFTMGAIVWFLAYNGAWFVLRYGWVWWALLPTGLVMLVNLGYAVRPYNEPFVIFLIASMLLMIHTHLMQRREQWEEEGLGYDGGIAARVLTFGSILSLALLILAWQGPSRSLAVSAKAAFQRMEQPWGQVQDRWQNAFAFLYPSSAPRSSAGLGGGFTSFGDNFELGGPLRLGNRTVFTAEGEPRQYWRGVAFDEYTGTGWKISTPDAPGPVLPPLRDSALAQRVAQTKFPDGVRKLEQKVTVVLPTGKSVFAADIPIQLDRDASWQLGAIERRAQTPVEGSLSVADGSDSKRQNELLELRFLLQTIGPERVSRASSDGVFLRRLPRQRVESRAAATATVTSAEADATAEAEENEARQSVQLLEDELRQMERAGITASYRYVANRPPVITYSYRDLNQQDLYAVTSQETIPKGTTYEVTSIVSNPTDAQLNKAKGQTPAWVEAQYLQVPDTVPARVRRLAVQLTRDADTTHEKAQAIERYLRALKYQENMPTPPADRDFVDYFLFELREGYCTSFSAAMAIMLRSVDIPARVVTGFAPGKFDKDLGQYVVTEAQAHAWPQVFYSEYGWVNYEPTPIRDLVSRAAAVGGDDYQANTEFLGRDAAAQLGEDIYNQNQEPIGQINVGSRIPAPVRFLGIGVLALLTIALVAYGISLLKLRGLRGARRQYAKLLQVGTLLGVRPALSHTPHEYGARLGRAMPNASASVRTITSSYVAEVFSKDRKQQDSDLDGEWKQVATQAARTAPSRLSQLTRRLAQSRPRMPFRRR